MTIKFDAGPDMDIAACRTDCLVLSCFAKPGTWPGGLPQRTRKQLDALLKSGDFSAKAGATLWLFQADGIAAERVLLLGCGDKSGWNDARQQRCLQALAAALLKSPATSATVAPLPRAAGAKPGSQAGLLARSISSAAYRYGETLSKPAPAPALRRVTLLCGDGKQRDAIARGLGRGAAIGAGMNTAKRLADLPGNVCTPDYFARQVSELTKNQRNVKTRILEEKQLDALGMGAFLSVSRGSDQPARLVTVEYRGGGRDDAPIVLVGKGVTFDSGGISLKPGAKMDEMKYDMCGAASVAGALEALIKLKAPINVVGLMACTENMPGGRATKPGDVVTSLSGTTIEILNTDAEGRLVMCDILSYAERYQPSAVIDIATLTGACIVALGHHHAAVLSNHQRLATQLLKAGQSVGDTAWQLPLDEAYHEQLKSNFADIANIGTPGAGTITAASFLSKFARNYHWAHLDIAGVAWNSGANKGATGRPVPLLVQYLLNQADKAS